MVLCCYGFDQLETGNLDLTTTSSLNWTINLAETVISADANYILRFKQHTDPANYTARVKGLSTAVRFSFCLNQGVPLQ